MLRTLASATVLSLALLGLTACGDDDSGSPGTDTDPVTIDVTFDDPKAYTRPWTTSIRLLAVPDTEMLDAQCLENEKDVPHLLNAK